MNAKEICDKGERGGGKGDLRQSDLAFTQVELLQSSVAAHSLQRLSVFVVTMDGLACSAME